MKAPRIVLLALLIASLLVSLPHDLRADIKLNFSTSSGYSNNLLSDSTDAEDSYSSWRASVNVYPHSSLEINLLDEYTYYSKLYKLSSFLGGGGVKFIPTSRKSPLVVLLSGNFTSRVYRSNFSTFNNDNYDGLLSIGYAFTPWMNWRAGTSYNAQDYGKLLIPVNKKTWKFFVGVNLTFFKSNSLDIETGYAAMDYKRINDTMKSIPVYYFDPGSIGYSDTLLPKTLQDDVLKSFYISPRFSRQIGSRTGINIIYTYRDFSRFDNRVVYGMTIGLLSPWTSIYDGPSISANLKTFLLPHFITTAGIGYWDKTYFKTFEGTPSILVKRAIPRHDYQTRVYVNFQLPLNLRSGAIIEPNLSFGYDHNHSLRVITSLNSKTISGLYDYNSTSVSAGVTIKL